MSTFDTMMDWEEGEISDLTALAECVQNLGSFVAGVEDQESFQAICKIVKKMTKDQWQYRSVK